MYEVTLFPCYQTTSEEVLTKYKLNDLGLRYYEIIAGRLYELLPKAELKVVTPEEVEKFVRQDDKFYLQDYDTVGTDYKMQLIDTCILVTKKETGEYFFIDFQDGAIHCLNYIQNEKCLAVFVPQHKHMYQYLGRGELFEFSHKCYPLCFFSSSPAFTESFREEILKIRYNEELIPKMYFSGNFYNGITYLNPRKNIYENNRAVVEALVNKYPEYIDTKTRNEDNTGTLSSEDYYKKVASYAVPLAMPGHPWSHREHEFWSMGIPTLSNTYTCSLLQPLLSNVDYIDAGTTGKDVRDREVDVEKAADLIFKRFKEVYKNREYLNWVSSNVVRRYESFSSPRKAPEYILELVKDEFNF